MTKLLPFDLEAAKAGAKVVTRDGRPARIVCFDAQAMSRNRLFPIVAVIGLRGAQIVGLFAEDGSVISGDTDKTLLIAPTPGKRWRVVYRGADDNAAQRDFETEAEAENFSERGDFNTNPFVVEVTP